MYAQDYNQRTPSGPDGRMYTLILGGSASPGQPPSGMGLLYSQGYISDGKIFYCPSVSPNNTSGYANSSFGWARFVPGYETWSSYDYRTGWYVGSVWVWGQDLGNDAGQAMASDGFIRDEANSLYGSEYHHKVGYNVLYTDGSVKWYSDPNRTIFNMGLVWNCNFTTDHSPWDLFSAAY